jgi:hypothetical protein
VAFLVVIILYGSLALCVLGCLAWCTERRRCGDRLAAEWTARRELRAMVREAEADGLYDVPELPDGAGRGA